MFDSTKHDTGKLTPSNCPPQIIYDIMEVQQYGARKYETSENWREIDVGRWINAFLRHTLAFWKNPRAIDKESGIPHYKMMACNLAFICDLLAEVENSEGEK